MNKKCKLIIIFFGIVLTIGIIFILLKNSCVSVKKPVIYLYPTQETKVTVNIAFNGDLTYTYPKYENGWNVTAYPNGTIIDNSDGKEYSYLFWEGTTNFQYDLSKGFIIKGSETETFLEEKLSYLGLSPRECNDFITYWVPQMQKNTYNLISFQNECYQENAKLKITPEPNSILRVFMTYKPLKHEIEIEEQDLSSFCRNGFTVIEWGGCKIE